MIKNKILFLLICLVGVAADNPKMDKVTITEGVTASLPKDFVPMSDDDIATKYPSTKKPLAMYTSLDRMVDFGLNVSKSTLGGNDLTILKQFYKASLMDSYTNIQFINEGIGNINGRDFIFFEFVSEADQTKKYTYVQYAVIDGRVYIFNFTVDAEKKEKWQAVAGLIMKSIRMDAKKLQETVKISQPIHKGKRPVELTKKQKAPVKK